jgi:hypothetical protein
LVAGERRSQDQRFEFEGEFTMADDKSNVGEPDRSRVAGGEDYEIDDFAQKHGISREQARSLIDRIGNDRKKLDAAAEELTR